MKAVKDIDVNVGWKDFFKQYNDCGGFGGKFFGEALRILREMWDDEECKRILSFPACIIATGCRGVIKELVKRKMVDLIVTTNGTLDHDLARTWGKYYEGSFFADDAELAKNDIYRLGNIFIPSKNYGPLLEERLKPILEGLEGKYGGYELVFEIGKHVKDEQSIIYWATRNKIPIIIPGFFDGAVGFQTYMAMQEGKFNVDLFKDEKKMEEFVFGAKRLGALMVGGGISKHHTIWWAQFGGGLDYAVYITTAFEYDGSLSGAQTREAVSWKKIKPKNHVTVYGDATILLPILVKALL